LLRPTLNPAGALLNHKRTDTEAAPNESRRTPLEKPSDAYGIDFFAYFAFKSSAPGAAATRRACR
jgi:hypothetical protein